MKQLIPLSLIVLSSMLLACNQPNDHVKDSQFTGLWTLCAMEKQDSITGQWTQWRNGMQGYLLYDGNGSMSLHLATKDYEKTELRFPNFTEDIPLDALKHLTNSYVDFAKYTLDHEEQIVQHARISHSNPKMWNEVVQRRYSFSGDTLTLQPIEKSIAGLRVRWIKE